MTYVISYLKKKNTKKNYYKTESAKFYKYEDAVFWQTLKEREGCLDFKIVPSF
jgi:hypothetical protein